MFLCLSEEDIQTSRSPNESTTKPGAPALACNERARSLRGVYANRRWTTSRWRFFSAHGEEIEQLLRNEAKRAAADSPLAHTMEFKRGDGHKLTVTTTTEHLAQRLGHALEKAFGGSVYYDFSHENKLARVSWRRD